MVIDTEKKPVKGKKKAKQGPKRGSSKRTSRKGKKRSYENVGRKSLFPGKDKGRHASAYFTPDTWKKLEEIRPILLARHKEAKQISISDILEEGTRRLHYDLTRPR
jgi:hypothetical protein